MSLGLGSSSTCQPPPEEGMAPGSGPCLLDIPRCHSSPEQCTVTDIPLGHPWSQQRRGGRPRLRDDISTTRMRKRGRKRVGRTFIIDHCPRGGLASQSERVSFWEIAVRRPGDEGVRRGGRWRGGYRKCDSSTFGNSSLQRTYSSKDWLVPRTGKAHTPKMLVCLALRYPIFWVRQVIRRSEKGIEQMTVL